MIVGRWYEQLAARWHWYLPLYIYVTFKKKILSIPFLKKLKIIFFFNVVSVN